MPFSPDLIAEFMESNPAMAAQLGAMASVFSLPKIVAPLKYTSGERAAREARDAVKIAKEEGAPSVFQPSACRESPRSSTRTTRLYTPTT